MAEGQWAKRITVPAHLGELSIALSGGTSDCFEEWPSFGIQVEFGNIGASRSITMHPEKTVIAFSGAPLSIMRISSLETMIGYSVDFRSKLPDELINDPSKIKNSLIIVLDGVVELDGVPISVDTITARIEDFKSWIKRDAVRREDR